MVRRQASQVLKTTALAAAIFSTVFFSTSLFVTTVLAPMMATVFFAESVFGNTQSTVKIEGMTCGGCEATVKEKVTQSPSLKDKVVSCEADANAGTAKITLKDGVNMSQSELETAVNDALKETPYKVATGSEKKAAKKK